MILQEDFLIGNISMKVVLEILFLIFSDINIWFTEKKLTWRSYKTAKTLPTIKKVKLIDKKKFIVTAIDENSETFIVHITSIIETISIHPTRKVQIILL